MADWTAWATWEWTRPWALAALALPLVLLALALWRRRPLEAATGTLALWRELVSAPREARSRARGARLPPPALVLALAALGAGALALAGPVRRSARAPRTFTVLVDRSPSMYLPADGVPGAPTRLARALDEARAWLARVREPGDSVLWSAFERGGWTDGVPELPGAWLAPPADVAGEPPFAERDEPGTLWLADGPAGLEPAPAPRRAGRVAVGGAVVPGAVGARGTTRIDWDGERLVPVEGARAPRRVRLVVADPAAADALADLVLVLELWTEERGDRMERVAASAGPDSAHDTLHDTVLELALVAAPPFVDVTLERDGWRAAAHAALHGLADPTLETWLALPAAPRDLAPVAGFRPGTPLVGWRPGRIEVALERLGELAGDPAPFAASWAELLDAAARPDPGVLPLSERRAARALATLDGERPPRAESVDAGARSLPTAGLASLAAALAAAAVVAASLARPRRGERPALLAQRRG